ncbi:putative glutamine amidotransferase [Pseudoclavibacter chungangensis]|nr:class II glutamine amidotransferase [Pseudoclavibacter chungangensis]NYJ67850.1 putative glutamine amidotransferase [Pseudoclavibacter chungangensis]
MCRLLAYAAPHETTISRVIGEMNTGTFQHMSRVHRDGWGTAWVGEAPEGEREVESLRLSTPGRTDPLLTAVLEESPAIARLAHLRLATGTFKRSQRNTHPFLADGIAFAHNGTIIPVDRIRALLEPAFAATVEGDTDSELYFALVRQNAARLGSLRPAVFETVRTLRREFPDASLNAVIIGPDDLIAVRASSTTHVTEQTFADLGIDPADLPDDHTDDYYRLSMRRHADGTTVFSSTGIDLDGWTEVPDDTVTHIDLRTLDLTQRAIFAGRAAIVGPTDEGSVTGRVSKASARLAEPVSLDERRERRAV